MLFVIVPAHLTELFPLDLSVTENCTGAEKKAFLKEIDTMKQVSSSEDPLSRFVVHMVGCVTTREPLLLILEFVKHGDLLSYFRSTRRQVSALIPVIRSL